MGHVGDSSTTHSDMDEMPMRLLMVLSRRKTCPAVASVSRPGAADLNNAALVDRTSIRMNERVSDFTESHSI